METLKRKPFQGVSNIVRFNWHFYVFAAIFIAALLITKAFFPNLIYAFYILIFLSVFSIIISLSVSFYIYDCSDLYYLNWLDEFKIDSSAQLVNINAGFDETSSLLQQKYPNAALLVLDFYDPRKHTEISIERARKTYPAFPGTKIISTSEVRLRSNSADYTFLILSAHEIRDQEERTAFFAQLSKALKINGKIVVIEHLRDIYNFMAYNFGFFHFFSQKKWYKTFFEAGLNVESRKNITPFIAVFTLSKNDYSS